MRLQGKTFVPGFKIEDDEEEFDDQVESQVVQVGNNIEQGEVEARPEYNHTEQLAVNEPLEQTAVRGVPLEQTTVRGVRAMNGNIHESPEETDSSEEEDSDDERSGNSDYETECYESYTRFRNAKKKEPELPLEGIDWESVNYELSKVRCEEDEITGLDVSDSYIAVQYYIESTIDIYDRKSFKHLFRLDGHEYGGQCLKISEFRSISHSEEQQQTTDDEVTSTDKSLLYSASMDCSLKSWNLKKQCLVDSITDHCDYVQSLTMYKTENADFIATGGRGDKAIFVYKVSNEGKFNRLFKLQGHTGWVTQTFFIDCLKPGSCLESNSQTREGNQHCPNYLLSGSEDGTIKLWDLNNKGVIRLNLEQDAGISCMLLSKLKGSMNTLVVFGDKDGKMSYLDLGTPEQLKNYTNHAVGCGNVVNGLSNAYTDDNDDDDEPSAIHLLPNILIGTGKYCRSCKYHDKAVDTAHLTDNGYLITASAGSKYVKIWKINVPAAANGNDSAAASTNSVNSKDSQDDRTISYDIEKTEVRELQILRDHTDYLSIFCVFGDSIYSSCSDGHIYSHTFPELNNETVHYDMAYDEEGASTMATTTLRKNGPNTFGAEDDDAISFRQESTTQLLSTPESSTEICDGPRLCRTGKAGLVRSSSSFQVSFQLKPSVTVGHIKLPSTNKPAAIQEEDEWDPDSDSNVDSDEYEVEYVSDYESDSS